ncbi:hypothetical protein B9Z55_010309 [Caenorhabditis nigoni]|uniref:Uncharacterized protein n=1 Tax=Caenorhabditis nigoni TaxID=1611254 RepID=A0A2G5UFB9_9PELO|nr:hypothetical protein B9Z55_010309 [Caenorhabditis nigoni]
MSKAIYEYHKINELIPGPSRWNFYGKIIFMCNIADQLLLLLKDETSSMYVYMNSKDNKEPIVGLKLRQVIRIHRGNVRRNPTTNTKEGVVQVEMAGCHFVAWPHLGDANNPILKSSKNWTKSDIDQEKVSELGNDQPITTAEGLAIQLVEIFLDYKKKQFFRSAIGRRHETMKQFEAGGTCRKLRANRILRGKLENSPRYQLGMLWKWTSE